MRVVQQLRNAYTTLAAIVLPAVVLLGWAPTRGSVTEEFEEITVQRINVVEPDGSLKLVISNSALQHPGVIAGDTIMPDRVRPAGVTFFDDRGDEAGGFGITGDGTQRWGGLMFDQINADEALRFSTQQGIRNGQFVHMAGMSIRDHNPDVTLPDLLEYMTELEAMEDDEARRERAMELQEQGIFPSDRMFVGRLGSGDVAVDLNDGKGRPRLRIVVGETGAARIEFLDEAGTITRTIDGS